MKIHEQVQGLSHESVGKAALALSGGGFTVQALTDFASLIAVTINILLGIGGLYLMWPKIVNRDRRRARRDQDGESK